MKASRKNPVCGVLEVLVMPNGVGAGRSSWMRHVLKYTKGNKQEFGFRVVENQAAVGEVVGAKMHGAGEFWNCPNNQAEPRP